MKKYHLEESEKTHLKSKKLFLVLIVIFEPLILGDKKLFFFKKRKTQIQLARSTIIGPSDSFNIFLSPSSPFFATKYAL